MKSEIDLTKMGKLIITAAITGGLHGKAANPNIPEQPDEQAQDAYECYNAGAAIVHLHVRDRQGVTTGDLRVYEEAISKIKAKCNILTQVGNGIGPSILPDGTRHSPTFEERLQLLEIEPKPDMITINAGTFNFGGGGVFYNPPDFNEKFVKRARERNIPVECECYDIGHINNILMLANKGLLTKPIHFSFVLGILGGIPSTPQNMFHMVEEIPDGSSWQVITISKYQLPMTVQALCMGANIRTGLEDNIYYSKGVLASNAQMVERMVRIAREIGREVATPEEAREFFAIAH